MALRPPVCQGGSSARTGKELGLRVTVMQYIHEDVSPGARTERRGGAGPVRVLLGADHAPAAFFNKS
jgi:hypothetical protein